MSLNHLKSKAVFACKILSAKCVISFQGWGGYAYQRVGVCLPRKISN